MDEVSLHCGWVFENILDTWCPYQGRRQPTRNAHDQRLEPTFAWRNLLLFHNHPGASIFHENGHGVTNKCLKRRYFSVRFDSYVACVTDTWQQCFDSQNTSWNIGCVDLGFYKFSLVLGKKNRFQQQIKHNTILRDTRTETQKQCLNFSMLLKSKRAKKNTNDMLLLRINCCFVVRKYRTIPNIYICF